MIDEMLLEIDELPIDSNKDFWDELTEQQKKNVEISLQQAKEGKVHDHEEVMKQVKTWLKK